MTYSIFIIATGISMYLYILLSFIFVACVCACVRVCVCACVCACVTEYDQSGVLGVLDTADKICSWTRILMYRLSADQMGGTTSTDS